MKQIIKRPEPKYLAAWKENFRNTAKREPEYDDFRETSEWTSLIYDLLHEQGYICCYCMKVINGWDSHIEHFIPRNIKNTHPHSMRAQDVELNYQNLFESCNGEDNDQNSCGRYKDSDENPMLISPIEDGVEQRFKYDLLTGKIDAVDSDDQAAMETIKILNLNTQQLCAHRLSAFYTLELEVQSGKTPESLIEQYSSRDTHGAFIPFCAAAVWALEHFYSI